MPFQGHLPPLLGKVECDRGLFFCLCPHSQDTEAAGGMRKRLKREGLPPPSDSSLWLLRAFTQHPYSVLILGPETGEGLQGSPGG